MVVKITLKAARINKGYTQEKAAVLLGVSTGALVSYEKGYTSPKLGIARRMSTLYGIPLDMLDFRMPSRSSKSNKGE